MDHRYLEIPDSLTEDRRLHPVREGVVADVLRYYVDADDYATGMPHYVNVPVCVLHRDGQETSPADTQLLFGEDFMVYGAQGDWCWGQAQLDHYVGWVRKSHLSAGSMKATHHVLSRGTFLYSEADMKSRPVMKIPMAARLKVIGEAQTRGSRYLETTEGWAIGRHLRPLDEWASDFVMVGESMIGLAYLWAGRSSFGIDCSGFIQLAMQMAGIAVLRDSDMQAQTIGEPVETDSVFSGLQRGDLIFWQGHVGMMRDEKTLLHANGHTMTVFSEPLLAAAERIAYLYDRPRMIRRPFALSA